MCFSFSSSELHVDALVGGKDLCVSESEGRQQQNCDIAYYCSVSLSLFLSLSLSFSLSLSVYMLLLLPVFILNCSRRPCVRNTCIRMSICLLYRCSTSPEIHVLKILENIFNSQHTYIRYPANVRYFTRIFLVGILTTEITVWIKNRSSTLNEIIGFYDSSWK